MSNEVRKNVANNKELRTKTDDEPRANQEKTENIVPGQRRKAWNESEESKISNERLVAKIKAGIDATDNMLQLWQQVENYVKKLANKYKHYAEYEDLVQEGYLSLYDAIEKYDYAKETTFISYATSWIECNMRRYIGCCCQMVRIPLNRSAEIRKYKNILKEFAKLYGRMPTRHEIRRFMGITIEELERLEKDAKMEQIQSLDTPLGEENDLILGDIVASNEELEEDVIKRMDTAAMKRELWDVVRQLPDEQQEVIEKRYKECMTRKDTGICLGITAGAVQNLESKAMRALRRPSRCEKLKVYYEQYLSACCYRHISVASFQRNWMSEVEWEVLNGL